MKQLFFFLLLLIGTTPIFAQSPSLINYQAVVRDGNGALITSGTVQLGIALYDTILGGTSIYFETHNTTPNQFGLVNVQIGNGSPISGVFQSINWASGKKFMQMYVNGLAMGARVQWVSVPFALHANVADTTQYAESLTYVTTTPPQGITSTVRNAWLPGTMTLSVPKDGIYLILYNARMWGLDASDEWWKMRIFNVSNNQQIWEGFGHNKGLGATGNADTGIGGHCMSALTAGQVIRLDYYVNGTGVSGLLLQGGVGFGNGTTGMSLIRIGN